MDHRHQALDTRCIARRLGLCSGRFGAVFVAWLCAGIPSTFEFALWYWFVGCRGVILAICGPLMPVDGNIFPQFFAGFPSSSLLSPVV